METFVIRIYRRYTKDAERLDGLLEAVEGSATQAFHGRDELWRLLLSGARTQPENHNPSGDPGVSG